jgi:NhaP-type Na+/H+ or K+/H+ antiporter
MEESDNVDPDEQYLHALLLYFILFDALLAFILVASKYLHDNGRCRQYISDAALTLVTGTIVGFLVQQFLPSSDLNANEIENTDDMSDDGTSPSYPPNVLADSLFSFSPNVFFMALLPPILFNSGYQLRRELFYRHINPILLLACVGTTLCALTTGFLLYLLCNVLGWMTQQNNFVPTFLELLTFGTVIAATDTVSILGVFQSKQVDPHLFYLVVGESALNDAVALVLFTSLTSMLKIVAGEGSDARSNQEILLGVSYKIVEFFATFFTIAVGSPSLGMIFAFGAALVFKCVDFRDHPTLELPLYMLLLYTPFFVAESLHLSGIVAIFFCGIFARRYVAPNVSPETERNADVLFKLSAFIAETCIFLDMGLSVFVLPGSFNWSFIGWAFVASLLGRAVGVYPLVFLYNFSLTESLHRKKMRPMEMEGPTQDGILKSEICEESQALDVTSRKTTKGRSTISRRTPEKRKDRQISLAMAHVLWFAGLRGALAYACVRKFPNLYGHADEFTATVMVIVIVSIVVMGGATETLLRWLCIDMNVDEETYMKEWHTKRQLSGPWHHFGTLDISSCSVVHLQSSSYIVQTPSNRFFFL